MQVVFEKLELPEQGMVELNMHRTFEINVTAEDARRKVNRWLYTEVSLLLVADPPVLMIGDRIVWQVPVWIGFPSVGRAGDVGNIQVDVQTGCMYALEQAKTEIEQRASALAAKLPPYKPHKAPERLIPKQLSPALRLTLE